jgi:phosphoserine phosphatase
MQPRDQPPPYGTLVFDCDSTLSAMEGIEELAGARHAEEIRRLTAQAMEGEIALEDVFGRRLALVRPSRADVLRIGREYVARRVRHAELLLDALRALGKRVVVVSGGLEPAVLALARSLGVEARDVRAVGVRFDAGGCYAGFDEASPLARSGGKIEVLRALARAGPAPLCFVGDGATDLEAAPECARFIAYGGVVRRAVVFERARVTCDVPDFAALAPLVLSPSELARLAREQHPLVHALPPHAPLDSRPH